MGSLSLNSVVFSSPNWNWVGDESHELASVRSWTGQHGDALQLHFFPSPEPPPFPPGDLSALRDFCRARSVELGAGFIEANVTRRGGLVLHRMVFKRPQEPTGFSYHGGVVISPNFTMNVAAPELGVTGLRETMVAASLKKKQRGLFHRLLHRDRWATDPYDRSRKGHFFKSDDSKWDETFPDHPLSRLRRHLADIEANVTIGE